MMAAGWKDGPTRHAPGFPTDGSWTVKWEGLNDSLAGKF
jgi:protein-glucosylgalactosylhydroxylysine glucosidase